MNVRPLGWRPLSFQPSVIDLRQLAASSSSNCEFPEPHAAQGNSWKNSKSRIFLFAPSMILCLRGARHLLTNARSVRWIKTATRWREQPASPEVTSRQLKTGVERSRKFRRSRKHCACSSGLVWRLPSPRATGGGSAAPPRGVIAMEHEFHPAADPFPMMSDEELDALIDDYHRSLPRVIPKAVS